MSLRLQRIWLLFVLLPCLVSCARSQELQKPAPVVDKFASLKTSELIGRLSEVSSQGMGSHSTAWFGGFLAIDAIDQEPEFHGGVIGARKPDVSPVMRELVRRGTKALPELLDHLNDSRPTKLVVGDKGFFTARWHSDEYDPRYCDPKKALQGVNTNEVAGLQKRYVERYTLRVGDLCYVAIGQMVNRDLNAVRYQPSACLVINSPVETPALAQAVKRDWTGLTAEQHEQSLIQDALDLSYPWAAPNALVRLLYYYPRTGESLALRMLDRPFCSRHLLFDFFLEKLVPCKDEHQWPVLLNDFRESHGEANYRGVLRVLVWASTFPVSQMPESPITESRRHEKQVADKLLTQLFPWFAPLAPPFLDAVDFSDQERLIRGLAAYRSAKFDVAILGVFRRCVTKKPDSMSEKIEQGDLACACVERLARKTYKDEISSFFERRLRELRQDRKQASNESYFTALDQRIRLIEELVIIKRQKGKE